MAWALVRSTSFSWAVSSGSKICSKQSGSAKRAVIKVMCSLQTPPMRVRTFSGLRGGVNSLCNMVNRSHGFHSTVAAATSQKASPILPKGDMFETFTDKANEVIEFAQKETRRYGYKFVGTEMILLGLIGKDIDRIFGESTDIAAKVFYSMDIYFKDARFEVQKLFGCHVPSLSVEIPFRPSALRVFELSPAEASNLHLLLGLLREGGVANHVLRELGACPINIHTQVMRMIEESAAEVVGDGSSGNEMPTLEEYGLNLTQLAYEKKLHPVVQGPAQRIADFVGDGSSGNKMPTLKEYGIDLTELAYEKNLHPVVERKPLINTLIQILGRRSINNPCLVGEHGVGKSSVVQDLAQRIADFNVPDFLSKKKVIILDEDLFIEDTLKKLMEEIKECNEIILFIDDVHTLSEWGFDHACNILMPAVARGEVQCVVATTPDDYLKRMKKYPALQRLFQPIKVPEATVDETIEILKGLQEAYEKRCKVRYTPEALVAAAHMSDQNIRHGFLPTKAIDVIDVVGAFVFNKEIHQARVLEMGHKINMLEIEQTMEEMKNNKSLGPTVTKADIEDIVADISHINAMIYRVFGYDKSCPKLF